MLLTLSKKHNSNPQIVTPKEFMDWAKNDLKTNDKRSIGNGLGNIKKTIHCRLDEIINNTHIKYCKGWNKRANIKTKLDALRLLNIKFTDVISLLTDIRNKYEHLYILPGYRQAQGYLDTAEMWLDISYDKYSFNKVAIVNLKITSFGITDGPNGLKLTSCRIDKNSNLDYLWDRKKEIHEIKNGELRIKPFDTVDWQVMAKYEAKHLIFKKTLDKREYNLPARLLTTVYKKAVRELIK